MDAGIDLAFKQVFQSLKGILEAGGSFFKAHFLSCYGGKDKTALVLIFLVANGLVFCGLDFYLCAPFNRLSFVGRKRRDVRVV